MTNATRTEIRKTIAANLQVMTDNMNDFWRRHAEDLIAGGVPVNEVVESMLSVAGVQLMSARGATFTAQVLRRMAEAMDLAADYGCEYPAKEH